MVSPLNAAELGQAFANLTPQTATQNREQLE